MTRLTDEQLMGLWQEFGEPGSAPDGGWRPEDGIPVAHTLLVALLDEVLASRASPPETARDPGPLACGHGDRQRVVIVRECECGDSRSVVLSDPAPAARPGLREAVEALARWVGQHKSYPTDDWTLLRGKISALRDMTLGAEDYRGPWSCPACGARFATDPNPALRCSCGAHLDRAPSFPADTHCGAKDPVSPRRCALAPGHDGPHRDSDVREAVFADPHMCPAPPPSPVAPASSPGTPAAEDENARREADPSWHRFKEWAQNGPLARGAQPIDPVPLDAPSPSTGTADDTGDGPIPVGDRRWIEEIVKLASGFDDYGALGPREPMSWESVGRVAIDYARAWLKGHPTGEDEHARARREGEEAGRRKGRREMAEEAAKVCEAVANGPGDRYGRTSFLRAAETFRALALVPGPGDDTSRGEG